MLTMINTITVVLSVAATAMLCKGDILGGSFTAVILVCYLLGAVATDIRIHRGEVKK